MYECEFCKSECGEVYRSVNIVRKIARVSGYRCPDFYLASGDGHCPDLKLMSKKKLFEAIKRKHQEGVKEGANCVVEFVVSKKILTDTLAVRFESGDDKTLVLCTGESDAGRKSKDELEAEICSLKDKLSEKDGEDDELRAAVVNTEEKFKKDSRSRFACHPLCPKAGGTACNRSISLETSGHVWNGHTFKYREAVGGDSGGVEPKQADDKDGESANYHQNHFDGIKCECGEAWPFVKETIYLNDGARYICRCGKAFGIEDLCEKKKNLKDSAIEPCQATPAGECQYKCQCGREVKEKDFYPLIFPKMEIKCKCGRSIVVDANQ